VEPCLSIHFEYYSVVTYGVAFCFKLRSIDSISFSLLYFEGANSHNVFALQFTTEASLKNKLQLKPIICLVKKFFWWKANRQN